MTQDSGDQKISGIQETELENILFPNGTKFDSDQYRYLFEQYKMIVQSAEQLAARRQAVNGFFLSLNTFMLAGIGFVFKESFELFVHEHRATNLMMLAIAVAVIGFIIDMNWASLLSSYGRVVRSQIHVTEAMEKHMMAALVTAQVAYHRKDLHSLSELERNIARTFQAIFICCGIAAALIVVLRLRPPAS